MRQFAISTAAVLAVMTSAYGHGVQIQVTHDSVSGKIQTREVLSSSGSAPTTISNLKRVYVMPLLPVLGGAGDGWYTRPEGALNALGFPIHPTGPGVMYQYDSQIPGTGWAFSGSSSLPNLENSQFGYQFASGLSEWNGSSFVDPGTEQLQMFSGDGTSVPSSSALTSDAGPFDAFSFSNISVMGGNPHRSAGFRLFGDGVGSSLAGPAAGDDGIYLASLLVTSTAAGVFDSDPIHFVMFKNASLASAITAAESLGFDPSLVEIVPEPSSLGLLLVTGSMALTRRRKRA
ncbi:MAG: PEP-CTERM sorting domain-containing protein [Phycisphaerales bacterium]|nr:PEP-CTERM sorting domain-containing protein [Phycisphaerales bacterium]